MTNPHSSASFALKTLFVNTNSIYLLEPIILGRKYVDEPSGVNPAFEYAEINEELEEANTKSAKPTKENLLQQQHH